MKKDFNSGKIVRQTGMSPEQYFQKLDSLLKRNKGYGMTIARDTGTNIPLNLTSTATPARMPELSGGIAAQQLADQAAARTQTRQVQQQTIPEYRSREEMAGDVMGASDFSNITTPQQFNDALSQIFNRRVSDPNVLGGTLPANKQSLYGYNPYPGQNWSPNSQESIDNGLNDIEKLK